MELEKIISDFEKWAAIATEKNVPQKAEFFIQYAKILKDVQKKHDEQLQKALDFGEILQKPTVRELIDKLINK